MDPHHEDGFDDVVRHFDGTVTLLLQLEDEICDILVLRTHFSLRISVFVNGVLEELINLLENSIQTSFLSSDSIDPTQGRNKVREKEGNHHLLAAFEQWIEPTLIGCVIFIASPKQNSTYHSARKRHHGIGEISKLWRWCVSGYFYHHILQLTVSYWWKWLDLFLAKDIENANFSDFSPELTVWGEYNIITFEEECLLAK